jgi:uncharacterized protein with NAD-binding domain and iron-sulfur cluster
MPKSVTVLGEGVAGLSAAHELAERGYVVSVYEKKVMFGGKARSLSVPNTEDIDQWLKKLAPFKRDYKHHQTGENNGDAHLKSLIMHH